VAEDERLETYAPEAWAHCVTELVERLQPNAVIAAGTNRGNEVLAHVGARLDLPFAANVTGILPGEPLTVTRVRWGGSLIEEARVHGSLPLLTVRRTRRRGPRGGGRAGGRGVHARARRARPGRARREHVDAVGSGVSLAEAKVVVSGGRGVGSAEGFGILEELAGCSDGAVGCSRVVTSAGWRPHTDQVGQTGTKISPELYIACGISGATQHMAGCKGAKKILADQLDAEAPIIANADYAVIGDLHEIVPGDHRRAAEGARHRPSRRSARARGGAGVAGGLFARRARLLVGPVGWASRRRSVDDVPQRVRNEAEIVLGQRKLLQRLGPG
jgi:electron transfer flavoprotein alpha subunit